MQVILVNKKEKKADNRKKFEEKCIKMLFKFDENY